MIAALAAFVVTRLEADLTAAVDRTLSSGATHIARGWAAEGAQDRPAGSGRERDPRRGS